MTSRIKATMVENRFENMSSGNPRRDYAYLIETGCIVHWRSPIIACYPALLSAIGDAGGSSNPVSSRLVGIRVGRMSAFGLGRPLQLERWPRMMAAPLVYLDPDMMSGIQEINDRTNDSSLVTFQASASTKCLKAIL